MDIALIVGVVLGLGAIVGSMAIAFASGAAGSFANFIDVPSLGIVLGRYDRFNFCCVPASSRYCTW